MSVFKKKKVEAKLSCNSGSSGPNLQHKSTRHYDTKEATIIRKAYKSLVFKYITISVEHIFFFYTQSMWALDIHVLCETNANVRSGFYFVRHRPEEDVDCCRFTCLVVALSLTSLLLTVFYPRLPCHTANSFNALPSLETRFFFLLKYKR